MARSVVWTHTRAQPPTHTHDIYTRTWIHTPKQSCSHTREKKKEIGRFNLAAFFSLARPPPLSRLFPLFRAARQDHQSTSRGFLRGYATRWPRGDRSGSPMRSPRYAHQGPHLPPPADPRDSSALSRYRGLATIARARANEATSPRRVASRSLRESSVKHRGRRMSPRLRFHCGNVRRSMIRGCFRIDSNDLRHRHRHRHRCLDVSDFARRWSAARKIYR